jgi:sulfur-oxidizing protein SoxY
MSSRILRLSVVSALLALCAAPSAHAGVFEDVLRSEIFGQRPLLDGHGVVAIKAANRPEDIRAVPFDVDAKLTDGRTIKAVTFVIDNNPSPVAASFKFGPGRDHVGLGIKFRLNQQSDIRAIVEASDGKLYMVTQLMKFPGGQAACSAPPATPAEIAAANMGKMKLADVPSNVAASSVNQRVRLELSHPNHTGMVLDQITLLYTPLKMVKELTVRQGDEPVFSMEGSIALNENPVVEFDFRRNGATQMTISATDTDGATFEHAFPIGPNS